MESNLIKTANKSAGQMMRNMLEAPTVKKQFEDLLGKRCPAFIGSLVELYGSDKYLAQCETKDVVMEALKLASLGLNVSSLGHAYIIAYGKKPTAIIGYKGIIQLAMNTNMFRHLNCGEVYEGMILKHDILAAEITFDPDFDYYNQDPNDAIGYFAYFELMNGFSRAIWAPKERIMEHAQKYSPSFKTPNNPWSKFTAAMCKKTVLRWCLIPYAPLSIEVLDAVNMDEPQQPTSTEYTEVIEPIPEPAQKTDAKTEIDPGF